ncbi:MAG: hypothetical protein EOM87_05380 [Clostridia bacterium]|nr:hypothetical protein [Clostridia bacterium]
MSNNKTKQVKGKATPSKGDSDINKTKRKVVRIAKKVKRNKPLFVALVIIAIIIVAVVIVLYSAGHLNGLISYIQQSVNSNTNNNTNNFHTDYSACTKCFS